MPERVHEFVVQGRGSFPIDMLRYDRCWPAAEGSSSDVMATFDRHALKGTRCVKIKGLSEPTVGRWESFGWKVIYS